MSTKNCFNHHESRTIIRFFLHTILASIIAITYSLRMSEFAHGQPFTTVINLPVDTPPSSINSDTQLNVLNGGFLEVVSDVFHVGNPDGSSENVELNLFEGGRILSRGFLSDLWVQAGGQLNIAGGQYQADLRVRAGGIVNVTGGLIAGKRPSFDMKDFIVDPGSNVTISGGEILSRIDVSDDSSLHIDGGGVRELQVRRRANTVISGGVVERIVARDRPNAAVTLRGGDFRRNGVPIPELLQVGSSLLLPTPFESGDTYSGTLADGTPFHFFEPIDGATQPNAMFTFERVEVEPNQPGVFRVSNGEVPRGYRAGQSLIVDEDLGYFQVAAGPGSQIDIIDGGSLSRFEADGAIINISGGTRSNINFQRFVTFNSEIQMSDGFILAPEFHSGSNVFISGGEIGFAATISHGSEAKVSGGLIPVLNVFSGSSAEIKGGEIPQITVDTGGIAVVRGGEITRIGAGENARVHLIGRDFFIDGSPIADLNTSNVFEITDRDVTLAGTLADGSPFSFRLDPFRGRVAERFDFAATLTVALVPEPTSILLLGVAMVWQYVARRRRG